jgi:hypothetical protein
MRHTRSQSTAIAELLGSAKGDGLKEYTVQHFLKDGYPLWHADLLSISTSTRTSQALTISQQVTHAEAAEMPWEDDTTAATREVKNRRKAAGEEMDALTGQQRKLLRDTGAEYRYVTGGVVEGRHSTINRTNMASWLRRSVVGSHAVTIIKEKSRLDIRGIYESIQAREKKLDLLNIGKIATKFFLYVYQPGWNVWEWWVNYTKLREEVDLLDIGLVIPDVIIIAQLLDAAKRDPELKQSIIEIISKYDVEKEAAEAAVERLRDEFDLSEYAEDQQAAAQEQHDEEIAELRSSGILALASVIKTLQQTQLRNENWNKNTRTTGARQRRSGYHQTQRGLFTETQVGKEKIVTVFVTVSGEQVCYQFMDTGKCSYGNSCKYSHKRLHKCGDPSHKQHNCPKTARANQAKFNKLKRKNGTQRRKTKVRSKLDARAAPRG